MEKKPLKLMGENFMRKSVVKAARKFLQNEVLNFIVKLAAKVVLREPNSMKAHEKLWEKQAWKKQAIEADKEYGNLFKRAKNMRKNKQILCLKIF